MARGVAAGVSRTDVAMATRVRFIQKIAVGPDWGCWEWQGAKNADGYGQFNLGGRSTTAQRAAYVIFVGDIAPQLDIDHRCNNRGCVNPRHLQAVTHRTNVLRSAGVTAEHARQTHCRKGHPLKRYVGPNSSQRYCPICKREKAREWTRKRRGSDPARYRV